MKSLKILIFFFTNDAQTMMISSEIINKNFKENFTKKPVELVPFYEQTHK